MLVMLRGKIQRKKCVTNKNRLSSELLLENVLYAFLSFLDASDYLKSFFNRIVHLKIT